MKIKKETIDSDTASNITVDCSKAQRYQEKHYGIIVQELQEVFP